MRTLPSLAVMAALAAAAASTLSPAARSAGPAWASVPATAAVFMQQPAGAGFVAPAPGPGPVQRLGTPSSAIPPGPPAGSSCSVTSPNLCSASLSGERCSALNDQGSLCSVFKGPNHPPGGSCSAMGDHTVCSVLPGTPAGAVSMCSTFDSFDGSGALRCSAVDVAQRQLCSIKGTGFSRCSTMDLNGRCSVLNQGAFFKSFCSAKLGQNGGSPAKACSTFGADVPPGMPECSILLGGNGVCTSFGTAPLGACSVQSVGHCSVIGGPSGNPCFQ